MFDHVKNSLRDTASVSAGYSFREVIDTLPRGDIAVIQLRNIHDGGVDWAALDRVELPTYRSSALLQPGDVIFTTRGTRYFALALFDIPGAAVCAPQFFILRIRDETRLHPGFLAWQLNQRPAQEYFEKQATGSRILNITRAAMEGVRIAIPPMRRQHQILAFDQAAQAERSRLTQLIENRNRQMTAIARQLYQSQEGNSTHE